MKWGDAINHRNKWMWQVSWDGKMKGCHGKQSGTWTSVPLQASAGSDSYQNPKVGSLEALPCFRSPFLPLLELSWNLEVSCWRPQSTRTGSPFSETWPVLPWNAQNILTDGSGREAPAGSLEVPGRCRLSGSPESDSWSRPGRPAAGPPPVWGGPRPGSCRALCPTGVLWWRPSGLQAPRCFWCCSPWRWQPTAPWSAARPDWPVWWAARRRPCEEAAWDWEEPCGRETSEALEARLSGSTEVRWSSMEHGDTRETSHVGLHLHAPALSWCLKTEIRP